jgi:hypothetical protein
MIRDSVDPSEAAGRRLPAGSLKAAFWGSPAAFLAVAGRGFSGGGAGRRLFRALLRSRDFMTLRATQPGGLVNLIDRQRPD